MNTAAVSLSSERLLELAHRYLSRALQCDYLSNGSGHRQSTPLRCLRPAVEPRPAAGLRPPGSLRAGRPAKTGRERPRRDIMYRYLDEIAARKRLSSSEEYRLAVRVRQGDEQARRSLIEHHLGLVVLLARPYSRRGLPMLDLIAEGNIGLLRAIEKFDPERGCRFSTYAKWWIRQSIELALMSQAGTVRVPVYVARALKQQAKANASGSRARASSVPCAEGSRARASSAPCAEGSRAGASSQCAQEPSSDESLPGAGQFLLHDIREARSARTARHDEPRSLVERLAAPEHEQPDWHLHLAAREKSLETAMLRLKPSEQRVLRARFGLAGEADCTLQSLADELNLSSERVRQIQSEALAKLRRILESEYGVGSDVLL